MEPSSSSKKHNIARKYLFPALLLIITLSCSKKPRDIEPGAISALDSMPEIAVKAPVGSDTITVLQINRADSLVTLRLSDLAEDILFVRLQNDKSALVADGITWVSGERIIVYTDGVVRQFDMTGRYLGRIGDRGHGPGEYTVAPDDIYVDEKAGRIYLIQPGTYKIVMYDAADGSFIKNIPLAYKLEKGRIHVDTENETVTVAAAPFRYSGHYANVWVQDFHGKRKESATRKHLAVVPDYGNEVYSGVATGEPGFTYSIFSTVARQDTLYSYSDGTLRPLFTYSWDKKLPLHEFRSAPGFYALTLLGDPKHADPRRVDKSVDSIPALTPLIVDRKSLRGNFSQLMLDNIGPVILRGNWLEQSTPTHFVKTFVPLELRDMIKEATDGVGTGSVKINKEAAQTMRHLSDSIHPADNNYVIIARWKTLPE